MSSACRFGPGQGRGQAGSRAFCCDNLAFRADLLIRRKHTRYGEQRFNQAIAEAVSGLSSFRDEEARRVEVLRQTELPEILAESLLLRACERVVAFTATRWGTLLEPHAESRAAAPA